MRTTSIPTIRRLYMNDVGAYKELQEIVQPHNHLVESSKDKDKPGPKSKPRKRRHSDSS